MKKILGIILALLGLLLLVFDHFFGTFLVPTVGSSLYKAGCFFGWLIGWGSLFASGIYLLFKTN